MQKKPKNKPKRPHSGPSLTHTCGLHRAVNAEFEKQMYVEENLVFNSSFKPGSLFNSPGQQENVAIRPSSFSLKDHSPKPSREKSVSQNITG